MQRCQYCGQLNDDFEENCAYCGGLLYIKVDHEEEYHSRTIQDNSHIDAARIAQELIDDERKRQKKYENQPVDIDQLTDIDSFAKELLSSENNTTEYIPYDEDSDRYLLEDISVGDDENVVLEDNVDYLDKSENKYHKKPSSSKNKFLDNQKTPSFNKPYLNNNITYTRKVYPYEEEPGKIEKVVIDEHEEEKEPEIIFDDEYAEEPTITLDNEYTEEPTIIFDQYEEEPTIQFDKEHTEKSNIISEKKEEIKHLSEDELLNIENNLKKKIKRNKKLENRLGLTFHDIELNLIDINKPIILTGKASINKSLNQKEGLQISVICYDNKKNEIGRSKTVFSIKKLFTYIGFSVEFTTKINSTSMLIILPEIVKYSPKGDSDKSRKIKRNSKKNIGKQTRNVSRENSIFIEQMKDIEHKIGMNIDNTSVIIKSVDKIEIVGEIYIEKPEKYDGIKIVATCYDEGNNIIATQTTYLNTKLYLGFDTLSVKIDDVNVKKVERVRLYPTFQ